jgi:RNA polymerase sigma factor (sigma-70 family)
VFIVLARRAQSINPKYLAGWLVNTSRLASRDAVRSRDRRQKREVEAAQMRSEIQRGDEPTAEQLSPLLDDALAKLNEADRSAVVMRFLQGRSFSQVGQTLGVGDDAARKRVERAVEKLRSYLCKSGAAPGIAGLSVILAAHQATAAPAQLASQAALVISSHSAVAATSIAKGVVWTMTVAKMQLAAVAIFILLIGVGGGVIVARHRSVASAAAATMPASQPAAVVNQKPPSPTEEKIQPNDRLRVSVKDLVGLNITTTWRPRVDPVGRISLPLVGQIQVGGVGLSDAEKAIDKAFSDAQIMKNAGTLIVFEERGEQISIQSGPFQIGDHLRLNIYDLEGLGVEKTILSVVDSHGEITPPLLDSVKVTGLTEFQLEKALVRAYQAAHVLANAGLTVERISAKEAAGAK